MRNSRFKAFLGLFFLLCIVLLPPVLGMDWDNTKSDISFTKDQKISIGEREIDYNMLWEKYKPIKITNALGLGSTLFEGAITEHTESCGSDCNSMMTIKHGGGVFVQDVIFETITENGRREEPIKDYQFYIKTGTKNIEVDDYGTQCSDSVVKNGTILRDCERVLVGSHIEEEPIWSPYNLGEELEEGIYEVKLEGEKEPYLSVDWIIKTQGRWLEEWATWYSSTVSTGIKAYYKLDETSGEVVDSTGNGNNGTAENLTRGATGKIENAFDFDESLNSSVYLGNPTDLNFSYLDNYSISLWIKTEDQGAMLIGKDGGGGSQSQYRVYIDRGGLAGVGTGRTDFTRSTTNVSDNTWHHIVSVYNGTENIFVDGVHEATGTNGSDLFDADVYIGIRENNIPESVRYDGLIDEIGLWNRSLTASEVSDLYNSGDGLAYSTVAGASVTLNDPSGGENVAGDVEFNATISPEIAFNYNLSNVTLEIWDSSPSLIYSTTETYTNQNESVEKNWTIGEGNFSSGDYEWNVEACEYNGTITLCNSSVSNETFTWQPFEITDEDHEAFVYETESETFTLNVTTISDVLQISGVLTYNGTQYNSVSSCDGSLCKITNTIDIPLVASGETANRSFYWTINIYDGSSRSEFNTSTYYQNTTRIHVEKCGGSYTVESLDFKAYHEQSGARINPYDIDGYFSYWFGSGDVKRTTNVSEEDVADLSLCLLPANRSYYLDADIEYGHEDENTTYVDRKYYYDGELVDNSTENVALYLLNATQSQTFILEVEDQTIEAVPNAFIHIQRWYPGEESYKTVQIAKTDDNGKSAGFYETETVDYKHLIYLDGVLELETDRGKVIPESVPYTLTFRIGESATYPGDVLETNENITSTITFNESTNITTFSWVDSEGEAVLGRFLVYKLRNNESNTLICNETLSFSSGTLTCNVSNYTGSFAGYGYIQEDDGEQETLHVILNFAITSIRDIFGDTGLLIGFFIILTAGLAFIWNPTAMIVAANVATIMVNLIGFIEFGLTFIFAMMGVSILIIIFMKT